MLKQFDQFEIQNPSFIFGGMKKADFIKSVDDVNDDDESSDDEKDDSDI